MPRQLYHLQVEGCGFPKWYNMPVKVLSVVCGLYEEKWLLFDHLGYFLTHLPTGIYATLTTRNTKIFWFVQCVQKKNHFWFLEPKTTVLERYLLLHHFDKKFIFL